MPNEELLKFKPIRDDHLRDDLTKELEELRQKINRAFAMDIFMLHGINVRKGVPNGK